MITRYAVVCSLICCMVAVMFGTMICAAQTARDSLKIVDLSSFVGNTPEGTPPIASVNITYFDHKFGAEQVQSIMKVAPQLLRNGEGWSNEEFTKLGTHSSTHVDAPWHYNSTIQGQKSQTIDELPLEWFYSDGVVLDMTKKAEGDAVTVADIKQELTRIQYTLKPFDIVLIRTGRDVYYDQPDYMFKGCGVTAEATKWLYDQGIRVMGIDAWGWDRPLDMQAKEANEQQNTEIFWAAHQVDLPYSHIERLMNLSVLPPYGFKVACFPLKVKNGSAGPARVVAIIQ